MPPPHDSKCFDVPPGLVFERTEHALARAREPVLALTETPVEAEVVAEVSDGVRECVFSVLDHTAHYFKSIEHVHADSETGTLREVVIGFPDNMQGYAAMVNKVQEAYAAKGDYPTPERTIEEFRAFKELLERHNVRVHMPVRVETREQIYSRDVGFVIGDTYFVSNMAALQRATEIDGIRHLIGKLPRKVVVPEGVHIEGGNVIVDNGVVYLGVGQRTNVAAIDFLREQLLRVSGGKFVLEPVFLKTAQSMMPLGERDAANDNDNGTDEDALHLDCAFMPVGEHHALIYPEAMQQVPESMRRRTWIPLTREEQEQLGTNVLSLSPRKVVSRDAPIMARLNSEMRVAGIEVLEIPFDQAIKCGGSLRCCTQPIVRGGVYEMPEVARSDQVRVFERLADAQGIRVQIAMLQGLLAQKDASVMDGMEALVDHAALYIDEFLDGYQGSRLPHFFNGIGTERIDMGSSGIDSGILDNPVFLSKLCERMAALCREKFVIDGDFFLLRPCGSGWKNLIASDAPLRQGIMPEVSSMDWLIADQIVMEPFGTTLTVKYRTTFNLPDGEKVQLKIREVRRVVESDRVLKAA